MLTIIWVKFTVEDKVFPKITKLLLSGTDVLLNMKLPVPKTLWVGCTTTDKGLSKTLRLP